MLVSLYKAKGERTECSNYRFISLLSVIENIYAGILVDTVRRVTEGLMMMSNGVSEEGGGV